jgi:hypothetical protein
MTNAVILLTTRSRIGRAFRGALNNVKSPTLAPPSKPSSARCYRTLQVDR